LGGNTVNHPYQYQKSLVSGSSDLTPKLLHNMEPMVEAFLSVVRIWIESLLAFQPAVEKAAAKKLVTRASAALPTDT
jgi:hypothetical protein